MNKIYFIAGMLGICLLFMCCSSEKGSVEKSEAANVASWPIFRGDNGLTGIANGQISDDLELIWSFKTEYDIKSSPVVGLGSVFIGSNDGFVYALDVDSGKVVWQFDTRDDLEAPPLLVDSTIYIGCLSGDFYALNAITGDSLWKFETDGQIHGSANWCYAPDQKTKWILVGSYDNLMYCFNSTSGELNWTFETEYYINGAPATDGKNVVFGGCDEVVYMVSTADGTKKWRSRFRILYRRFCRNG